MKKKIFISYSHKQGQWVKDVLLPTLNAGRADVLIDSTRFEAGVPPYCQMETY